MDAETSTEMNDSTRGRSVVKNATAKTAGVIVISSVVLLALIRLGFRGRAY